jgi:glycosyltransferase involved in cell wall biosynthesis
MCHSNLRLHIDAHYNARMMTKLPRRKVSIILPHTEHPSLRRSIESALTQDYGDNGSVEVILADARGPGAPLGSLIADLANGDRVRHVTGAYPNRATMLNAAIATATGDYLLLVDGARGPVKLRRSAVATMMMAAVRNPEAGLIYADYAVDSAGSVRDIHLLDWHPGRLRDSVDFGPLALFCADALKQVGLLNEKYCAADMYDLRLRASEHGECVHIANRFAGALCSVEAAAKQHDVFDYLLASRESQLEMEEALTEHLKRTGAYLSPTMHAGAITYTREEEDRFAGCIGSVVIPCHRRPEFIGQAIESVQKQTVQNIEVIVVVNGGETDPTAQAVRQYMEGGAKHRPDVPRVRLIVVDVNNLGLCLNSGIAAAHGKFYFQLDSDDRLKPDAVEKLLAVFDSDPAIAMVIGSYEVWTLDEKAGRLTRNEQIPVVTHDEWTADNGRNNLLRINGAGAPRAAHIKAIADVGWFGVNDDPQCRNYGEDYDLVLRISERYAIGRVWEPIYEVIRHSGGTDHSIDQQTIDRNDNAKDAMRLHALRRRQALHARHRSRH